MEKLFTALSHAVEGAPALALAAASGKSLPASSYFDAGRVFIVSSSHQDTAWMDTPAFCRQFRIEHCILPALEMMRKDPQYTFCMEGTLHAMEFLEAHPELRSEVIQRMREGRLEFGATYNEPYESWLSGEELIRETYFGRRWIKENLPGCDAKVAFNPDPPGRSLQMQQILAKAGIPYLFISRYHEGLYRWQSPDGSSVLAYSPGHYSNHLRDIMFRHKDQLEKWDPSGKCMQAIHDKLDQQSAYYAQCKIPPVYSLINTWDFAEPMDFNPLINLWNAQSGTKQPTMSYGSISGFFEAIDKPSAKFDTLMGERPDVWVYITGPTHHWTASARREAARLLPAAETFTTIASLLAGNFHDWPTKEFNEAWMDELYMDHGIGGKNGHITDEIFLRKIEHARDTGRALLYRALGAITAQVQTNPQRGTPVTIFNTLSWTRSEPVMVNANGLTRVVDAEGKEIPAQLTTLGEADELDVATAALGATATASSVISPDYGPEKAINGKWAVSDPDPALGAADKWTSDKGAGPHWLTIDFGQPRTIHKVVIRHEGVMGMFKYEARFNTTDFRIQSAAIAAGPWTDLVAPIMHNTNSLTVHNFAPRTFRWLRVFITKGAVGDTLARLYEVQAFTKATPQPKLLFIASDVPPLGYKTYYLCAGEQAPSAKMSTVGAASCENKFYRVALAPGGIQSIFDKQQNRELLRTDKFLGGEVFTMLSVAADNRKRGTDAGEFGAVPLPVMDESFDRVAQHKPDWKVIESGPVRTVYQLEQPLADTTVQQSFVMWHASKRLDCGVDLQNFNGKLWREFRMALPLALEQPQLAYEVPMGVVEIGKDEIPTTGGFSYGTLDYFEPCRDIHPREVQDFLDASDRHGGLTLSSSVSVFDWKDPTTNALNDTILQPVLLASRKTCHGLGNWYPQAGDHHYQFAITSHVGGWRNGWRDGMAANHPLQPIIGATQRSNARLPESQSFFSTSESNVLISTIKKCEDDDSVVVRLYDIEGRATQPTLACFLPVRAARHTNIIEEQGDKLETPNGQVQLSVGKHAIETIKLNIRSAP